MTQVASTVQTTTPPSAPAVEKNVTDNVLARVNSLQKLNEIHLPPGYSAPNALKSAWLLLTEMNISGKPVLQLCTKESIANSLLKMVVEGLSPMKHQCAFIVYGDKLNCQRQYQGNIALAKRFGGVKDVNGTVIYEADTFDYTIDSVTGRKKVVEHKQSLKNIDKAKIIGAYATVIMNDGTVEVEVMTMDQIRQSWQQGATKGNSPAHKNFPDQMCIKTVINRGCKLKIQSSDDAALRIVSDPNDDIEDVDHVEMDSNAKITQGANKEVVTFDQAVEVKEEVKEPVGSTAQEGIDKLNKAFQKTDGPGF